MEVHRPDTRHHNRAPGIGSGAASSWNHEDRTVDKSPTQLSETFLPLLLTLLFGARISAPAYRAADAVASDVTPVANRHT